MAEYKYKIIGDTKQAVVANEQLEGSVEDITKSTNKLKILTAILSITKPVCSYSYQCLK